MPFHSLKRAMHTVRPPRPVATMRVSGAVVRPHALLTSVQDLAIAWRQYGKLSRKTVMIVLDARRGATTHQSALATLVESLPHRDIVVGIPDVTRSSMETRPFDREIQPATFGSSGWVRVVSESMAILPHVDVPAELTREHDVILLTASRSLAGVVGAWPEIVHPSSAMRARMAPSGAATDLSLAVPATYVILLNNLGADAVAIVNGPLAGELVALGAARLTEHIEGVEAEGPWEDARVQRLVESSIGAGISTSLSLDAIVPDNKDDRPRQWMTELADVLGCRLSLTGTTMQEDDTL